MAATALSNFSTWQEAADILVGVEIVLERLPFQENSAD